jgi:hypothetical protein
MKKLGLLLFFWLGAVGCAQSVGMSGGFDGGLAASGGGPTWGNAGTIGNGGSPGSGGVGGTPSDGGSGATVPDASSCALPTPDSECRTAPLCGCAAGQNCAVADPATGRTVCVDPGSAGKDAVCSGVGSCGVGTTCIGGTCKAYCATDADCGGGKCIGAVYGNNPVPGLMTCTSHCALDQATGCGAGAGCFLLDGGVTDCRATGTSTTSCSGVQDCAPGYQCFDDGTCAAWCRAGGAPCAVGSCQTGTGSVIVDGVVYGACF